MVTMTPAVMLVGRESELALLSGLMKQAAQGHGGAVLIEGEPGIGKSALVRAAVAEAPEAGCQVFWGPGTNWGRSCRCCRSLTACGYGSRRPTRGGRRSSGCCAAKSRRTGVRMSRRCWPSSCWPW